MGARDARFGHGWFAFGLLLALTGVAKSSLGSPVPAEQTEGKEIAEAISALRHTDIRNSKDWAMAARKLAQIGKPAVPGTDRGARSYHRESTTAVARLHPPGDRRPEGGAGTDPAIPRTLVPAGSDFMLTMDDPELLAFLQQHDLHKGADGQNFSFGMPYREITGALHAITGQRLTRTSSISSISRARRSSAGSSVGCSTGSRGAG